MLRIELLDSLARCCRAFGIGGTCARTTVAVTARVILDRREGEARALATALALLPDRQPPIGVKSRLVPQLKSWI